MCGLVGLFTPQGARPPATDLTAALAAMRHRGPDGTGRWESPDRRYLCGFARLAIIDLATGDQPIVEGDGANGVSRVLMGNGEVYNYLELRREQAGYRWRTQGDMEVVLPLAAQLGKGFVHRLNGMYGLALYDRQRHRLTLVRDRLGIKPLYWARLANGGLAFASEVKALFATGMIQPAVDEAAVAQYLAHGYVPAPATLWTGVAKLPPGHLLEIEADGRIGVERYWRAQPAEGIPTDAEGVRDHLTALLDDAVGLQLRSDVALGALLSGGIDSGLMVALAARRLDRPLNTYTVRFEGAAVDESPLAALVAARYGTRHQVFDLSSGDVARHLPRLAWHCDEPLSDASLLPNQLIEDVLGAEVRVALNGTGGDELFAGYGRYFQLPVEANYLRLPRPLRRMAQGLAEPMTAWRLARAEKFAADRGGYLHDHSTLFPAPIRALMGCRLPGVAAAQALHFAEWDGDADSGALYADLNSYLPEDLLLLLDRTTMAASVEGRVPFLDHRLVEAALAVPPHIRAAGGRAKALERAMAAPFLPAELLDAPKQGFASPVPAWMTGELGAMARGLLCSSRAIERGWWTEEGIGHLLADPERHGHRVYALLMLELVIRLHGEGEAFSGSAGVPPAPSLAGGTPALQVSVIMPAFRAAATIGRAVASVAAQSVRPAEIVVVDDGSDDETIAAAEACRPLLGEIRLIVARQDQLGAGAARNHAIRLSSGAVLAFLDADDEWLPRKLEASLAELSPDLAFVSHDMVVGEGVMDCARHFRQAADPHAALFVRGFVATSTVVARREAVLAAGGFDERLRSGQDYALWLAIAGSRRFTVFAGALTRYHITAGSITSQADRRRECNMAIIRRHLPALRARRGWRTAVTAGLTRLAVVHYESLAAHRAARRWGRMAAVLAALPVNLAETLAAVAPPVPPGRLALLLWLWIAAMATAYLWQFQELAGPVLRVLGIWR
ncbi:MAG: asparagine synthase (glutamine-hydrolyzing) [Magnetospirillum sp.]|nr:asparagine synthase (glutamine-hydrolyzing) [Magnetospirillum sp.]